MDLNPEQIIADAQQRIALKEKLMLSDSKLQEQKKKLKTISCPRKLMHYHSSQEVTFRHIKIPTHFNWAEQFAPGIIKVKVYQPIELCSITSVLGALADQFYISRRIDKPIVFSDAFLFLSFTKYFEQDRQRQLSSSKKQLFDLTCFEGIFTHNLILFLQNFGVTSTRCLEELPKTFIPVNTCYYARDRATYFLRDPVASYSESRTIN